MLKLRGVNKEVELRLRDPDTGVELGQSFLFGFMELGLVCNFAFIMKDAHVTVLYCHEGKVVHYRIGKTNWVKITSAMVEAGLLIKSQGAQSLPTFTDTMDLFRHKREVLPPARMIGQRCIVTPV